MLKCNEVCKKYKKEIVIENFSYVFNDKGFYLMLGESGSGKTTFLNILSGLLSFEKGSIKVDNDEFKYCIAKEFMADRSEYITQDAFFVEFLNVQDNLRVVCDDDKCIDKLLDRFDLTSKLKEYPDKLSGGEKQRIAIIRSLLSGKKILFLDEPTASLDIDNKKRVFEMLKDISREVLIVCSSHDQMAMEYADETISFEKKRKRCWDEDELEQVKPVNKRNLYLDKRKDKKNKLFYFLSQWFKSKKRNKISSVLFGLFLIIAMGMCLLAEKPSNRMNSNVEYMYKVNMCMLRTYCKDTKEYKRLCNMEGVKEVVLDYGLCLPLNMSENEELMMGTAPEYETIVYVLPSDEEVFKLSDKMLYGSYFTDKNQIILAPEMAESLMPENTESLIGKTLVKEFYGIGEVELEIVGIFDYFDDYEKEYMRAMGVHIAKGEHYDKMNYEYLWYINGDFTEQFVEDETFFADEQRGYTLYFDSYNSMKKFYDENRQIYGAKGDYLYIGVYVGKLLGLFDLLYKVFLPLAYFVAFFTILFYINLVKTEIVYNNRFIAVMDYAGYKVKRVINRFIVLNLVHLFKLGSISMIVTLIITNVVNLVNEKYKYVEFQIFSYNVKMLLEFMAFLMLVSVVAMFVILSGFKKMNWYENIIKNRDLI